MRPTPIPSLVVACALLLATAALEAQSARPKDVRATTDIPDLDRAPRPSATATRIFEPIIVDGRLSEGAWDLVTPIDGFVQNRPNTGAPATERTVVRIAYDDDNLYIGAMLYDSDPARIVARSMDRDYPSGDEDGFGIVLGTFLDGRSGFMFGIGARGGIRTGQISDDGRDINYSWRPVFHWMTTIHAEGWTVEMSIPFRSLRFDPTLDEQVWALNLLRRVKRKNEDAYWAPLDRRWAINKMSMAGTLRGIHGIRGTRGGAERGLKPYVLAAQTSPSGDTRVNGGADFKMGVTKQVTLDMTYRTDFSHVEVDDQVLNLSRFSLFLPDKRDFFIENSGIFAFGDAVAPGYRMGASPQDFQLFHSRRIGLHEGREVPVMGGARLTGRARGIEFGVLDLQTSAGAGLPRENMSIARARTTIGTVQVGAMAAGRHALESVVRDRGDYSFGADVNAQFFDHLLVQSYIARTTDGPAGPGDGAGRVSVGWRDRIWNASVMYREMGEDFNPSLGFVRRTGMRQSYATLGGHITRLNRFNLLDINPWVEVDYITNQASVLETRSVTAGTDLRFRPGDSFAIELSDNFERIERPFRVLSSVDVPIGDYQFGEAAARFQTSRHRTLSGNVRFSTGGYYGGTRRSAEFGAAWKPNHFVSAALTAQAHAIAVSDERFTATVVATRLTFARSTRLMGGAFVQYNGITREWISNVRVNLIHAPLSDLFIVLTERRDASVRGAAPDRHVVVKVTRLVQL